MAKPIPRKVLIVEDNALNMRLFSDLLEASGYETLQCVDGAKAVGIALEEKASIERAEQVARGARAVVGDGLLREDDTSSGSPDPPAQVDVLVGFAEEPRLAAVGLEHDAVVVQSRPFDHLGHGAEGVSPRVHLALRWLEMEVVEK